MSRKLDDLSRPMRAQAVELIARLTERQVYVLIVDTLRTFDEHQRNLAAGHSWTRLSKHLPRALRGWPPSDVDAQKSDAMDLCPWEVWQLDGDDKLGWRDDHPHWPIIRDEAERLGLTSGARWKQADLGHVELKF